MYSNDVKKYVVSLRRQGKTYGEIKSIVELDIPKSTLSNWCNGILLSSLQKANIQKAIEAGSERGRRTALLVNRIKREAYLKSVEERVSHIPELLQNKNIAKIAAASLYLGEGGKAQRGWLVFGNSNPNVIALFLSLLRHSYNIDERKFRCTLQCRADQNVEKLERLWSRITKISRRQFYKARIDPRTIGKPSRKPDYRGVCRIEYFSADLFIELMTIGNIICKKGR